MNDENGVARVAEADDAGSPLVPGRTAMELAELVRSRLSNDRDYAQRRRRTWQSKASTTHLLTLGLSAAATVILGIADLDPLATVGFVLSALVTTVGAVEPFFNWRSRWVLAEEALAAWYRLDDELNNYVSSTNEQDIDKATIIDIDKRRQAIWDRFSQQWLQERRRSELQSPAQ